MGRSRAAAGGRDMGPLVVIGITFIGLIGFVSLMLCAVLVVLLWVREFIRAWKEWWGM